jgi:hypothetical protein
MKRSLSSLVAVTIGLGIGCGIGYSAALLNAGAKNVLVTSLAGSGFQQVFTGMGKLYALEALASNCKGSSDMRFVLGNEEDLIVKLRGASNGTGLNPAIDVAESRLAIRNAIAAEAANNPQLQSEQGARAGKLLERSGWMDPSDARMRRVIAALDQEECGQAPKTQAPTQ